MCIPLSGLAFRLSRLAGEARNNGVQSKRVWALLIGVDHRVVVEAVAFDDDAVVVTCRPREGVPRCDQVAWLATHRELRSVGRGFDPHSPYRFSRDVNTNESRAEGSSKHETPCDVA